MYNFLNKQGAANPSAADADTPIVCDTCLGANPYVRMSKQRLGSECKICARPFTVFRWNPGTGMRFKKTEICTTCAKLKNVCQSCILDLEYGLPTHVRDSALGIASKIPQSETNRQYYVNHIEARLEGATMASAAGTPSAAAPAARRGDALARTRAPDYAAARPHLCSFFARGACARGDACPYRHEAPARAPARAQAPASASTPTPPPAPLVRAPDARDNPPPPADESLTTLFFAGVAAPDLGTHLAACVNVPAADIADVRATASGTFVRLGTRAAATRVAAALGTKAVIDGRPARLAWARRNT